MKNHFSSFALRNVCVVATVALLCGLAPPIGTMGAETAPPQVVQPATAEMVGPIQLRDASLDQVLEMFERMSGRTLLKPQTLPTVVINLNLEKQVTKAEAMRARVKSEAPELIEGSTRGLPPTARSQAKVSNCSSSRSANSSRSWPRCFTPRAAALRSSLKRPIPHW